MTLKGLKTLSDKEIFITFVWPKEDFDFTDPDGKITVTSYAENGLSETTSVTYSGEFVLSMIGDQIHAFFNTLNLIDKFGIVHLDNPYPDKE